MSIVYYSETSNHKNVVTKIFDVFKSVRNYAKHRARIPDSPTTKQHMAWAHVFIHEFVKDNFETDIEAQIPSNLLRGLQT